MIWSDAAYVIIRSVPAHAFMAGNPIRHQGWVCCCGERLSPALSCDAGDAIEVAADDDGLQLTPRTGRPSP